MTEVTRADGPAVRLLRRIVPVFRVALPVCLGLALGGVYFRTPAVIWTGLVGASACGLLFLGAFLTAVFGARRE